MPTSTTAAMTMKTAASTHNILVRTHQVWHKPWSPQPPLRTRAADSTTSERSHWPEPGQVEAAAND